MMMPRRAGKGKNKNFREVVVVMISEQVRPIRCCHGSIIGRNVRLAQRRARAAKLCFLRIGLFGRAGERVSFFGFTSRG